MKNGDIFKCDACNVVVEVVHAGKGLVCCGKEMSKVDENTVEASHEKHIPVIEKTEKGYLVKVGSIAHPMEQAHFIEWIEFTLNTISSRIFLNPGDKPEALFAIKGDGSVSARAYCNLHGLWKGK